jgi:hypothetical protein
MNLTYQIVTIQGDEPYNIYVCDGCEERDFCIYIDTINNSDLPYEFDIPQIFQNSTKLNSTKFCIKSIDSRDCENCDCVNQGQTPTPSVTPSITPTISITPSITPTISITPSITPTISITPSITPTISITPSITPTISLSPNWILVCDAEYFNGE